MKIYLDFDGTLFNTDKFYQDYLKLLKEYNIDEATINNIKPKLFKSSLFNLDILTNYLVKEYNLDNNLLARVNNLYNSSYVFKDVIPFLEKYKTLEINLLTYGDYNYQLKKIEGSNLKKYFKDIIITDKDKSKLNLAYETNLFIDNNPKEINKFLEVSNHVIRIRREEDKYSKLDSNSREYKSLLEIVLKNVF